LRNTSTLPSITSPINRLQMLSNLLQGGNTPIDLNAYINTGALQTIDIVVAQRRDETIFLRAQAR
jgi:hypothetical protein